jgi:hypothetical protein
LPLRAVPLALKLVTLILMPLAVLAMMPAGEADARGGRGGGARFGKPHGMTGGHHHHRFRHSNRFHSGARFGFFLGGAALVPWYYAPAPYYVQPAYPTTYVEQDGYWYYCPAVQAYYPYVTQCPGAEWQRVDPVPPPAE